jgi:hypothetical protein
MKPIIDFVLFFFFLFCLMYIKNLYLYLMQKINIFSVVLFCFAQSIIGYIEYL